MTSLRFDDKWRMGHLTGGSMVPAEEMAAYIACGVAALA